MGDATKNQFAPKGKSWLKENPSLAKLGLLGVLLVVLLVVVVFSMLGSGETKPKGPASASTTPAAPPPAPLAPLAPPQNNQSPGPETPESEGPAEGGDAETEAENPQGSGRPAAPEEAKPERPEKVADWKKEDYFSARDDNDRRLIEAVEHLGKQFSGNAKSAPNAARLLAKLLAPPKVEEKEETEKKPGAGRPRPTARSNPKLIEAVVAALKTNGSDAARGILEQLLAGTLPSDDDRAAAMAALETLAADSRPENEAILFRALTEAEKLRPADRGDLTAEELRSETLVLIESSASEPFRLKLANFLLEPNTPREWRTTMGQFLEQDHPDNLGAQLVLYQHDDTAKETKNLLEGYFTTYSSQAMARILGISTETAGTRPRSSTYRRPVPRPQPGRRPPLNRPPSNSGTTDTEKTDPDLPYRMARHLWGAPCVAMVENGLGQLESLEEQSPLLLLAGTIPADSLRSTIFTTLQEHWSDGPTPLESAGWLKRINDPGLMLVFKTMPRQKASTRVTRKEAREKFQKTRDEWTEFSDNLVRTWCQRFHTAALARSETAQSAGNKSSEDEPATGLAIKLHADAKVAAEYHLKWPDDVQTKLAGAVVGTTEIHYVRIEEEARYKKMTAYYKRQTNSREVRLVDGMGWVEGSRNVSGTDRKRSIDVLVSRPEGVSTATSPRSPGNASKKKSKDTDEAEDLIIEILSTETTAPASGKR